MIKLTLATLILGLLSLLAGEDHKQSQPSTHSSTQASPSSPPVMFPELGKFQSEFPKLESQMKEATLAAQGLTIQWQQMQLNWPKMLAEAEAKCKGLKPPMELRPENGLWGCRAPAPVAPLAGVVEAGKGPTGNSSVPSPQAPPPSPAPATGNAKPPDPKK